MEEQEQALNEIKQMMENEEKPTNAKPTSIVENIEGETETATQQEDDVRLCQILSEVKDLILKSQKKSIWQKVIACTTYVIFGVLALVALLVL